MWLQVNAAEREQIKQKLPELILNEPKCVCLMLTSLYRADSSCVLVSKLVRHSSARVVAAIASIEIPLGQWNELMPFLESTCTSADVAHREVGSYILFTVLENIVEGFESHMQNLFRLFEQLIVDPESLEVRITAVRSLGVVAQYIDADDKEDIVSCANIVSKTGYLPATCQKSFQRLLPSMINVIGQCVEASNEQGARQLFDVLETLLILVRILQVYLEDRLMQISPRRKFPSLANIYPSLPSSCSPAEATATTTASSVFSPSTPLNGVANLVERADDLKQGLGRGLADAVVVVRQLRDELDRALLDERQEVHAR